MHIPRPVKILGACLLALIVVRELGWLNVDWSQSHALTRTTITRNGADETMPLAKLTHVSVWPSPFDYIPFYKSRTVRGEVVLPAGTTAAQARVRCEFTVELTVTGICSARQFRDKIRQKVVDAINKRKKR